MDKAERSAKIEEYGRGYDLLTAALAEVPRQAWDFKPAPGEWSIHELLIHMADSEAMGALRIRKMIVEPGTTLMTYDETQWAQALDYSSQNAGDALESFRLSRLSTYRLLKNLPDSVFSQSVVHPNYAEPYTIDFWLKIYANHVPEHIEQLKKIHRAWKGQNS